MTVREKYQEIYRRLLTETAEIVFIKSNGQIRTMLATRNAISAEHFGFDIPFVKACIGNHDKRCNINNGNMAVVDLIIGEGRSFNIERLVSINWVGEVDSKERADAVYRNFKEFEERYKESKNGVSFDDLKSIESI